MRRYADERDAGEAFQTWLARVGGVDEVRKDLLDLDSFPEPDDGPEYYVDYGETGPYVAEVGDSESAT